MIAAEESEGADTPAVVLQPSSPWSLNYADDSCRLARLFGEGKQKTLLQLEQFEPNRQFMLAIAGGGFGNRLEPGETRVQFGPAHPPQVVYPHGGALGEYSPAMIVSSARVREVESYEQEGRKRDLERYELFEPDNPVTEADEQYVEWIGIEHRGSSRLRLETGTMGDAFAALNACSEELLTHWGLDLERYKARSMPPIPKRSPGTWLSYSDYPSSMLRKELQGLVYFRVMIDAEGKPSSCHIQQSSRPEDFEKAVCRAIMRRARFEPALDADGEPMASYYRNTVRFTLPD